jgi:hypothetical protein
VWDVVVERRLEREKGRKRKRKKEKGKGRRKREFVRFGLVRLAGAEGARVSTTTRRPETAQQHYRRVLTGIDLAVSKWQS